LTPSFEENPLT